MTRLHRIVFATAAVLVTGGVMSTGVEAKCVRAGGQATMITEDLAKFMANAALQGSITKLGAKAKGPVVYKCTTAQGLPSCVARQVACN